jgi:hypothetical protein
VLRRKEEERKKQNKKKNYKEKMGERRTDILKRKKLARE